MTVTEVTQIIGADGTVYDLESGVGPKWVMTQEGWGMPSINYLTTRDPQGGAETVVDYRLPPRFITMLLRQGFCSREEYWAGRSALLNAIRFNQGPTGNSVPVTLRRRLSDGNLRDLEVYILSGPGFTPQASTQWDQWGFTEQVRFVAYNPVVTDPAQITTSVTLAGLSNLVFPITFPIVFGSATIDDTQNIVYAGTWLEYPLITITGPFNSPIITNNTTGEVIALSYEVPAGRTVTIDLTYGIKSVMDDQGRNLIGVLTPASAMETWHLAPDPEAPGGVNQIRVQGTDAQPGVTDISILHHSRYIGI
jgi:hypothetical protein